MDKLLEELSPETLNGCMEVFESDQEAVLEVKDEEMTKVCDLFVTKCNSENKLGFDFSKFMEFLIVTFSIRKNLSQAVCRSENFVPTIIALLEAGSVIKEKTSDDYAIEDQKETDEIIRKLEDETPVYYYGSEEEEGEGELINQAAVSGVRTACAMLDVLNYENKGFLHESNLNGLSKLNNYLMDQLHDQNEEEDMTRIYSHLIMSLTSVLGFEELEKNIIPHKNQENFYVYMLRAFNDAEFNMLDKVHYFSMLITNYDLCSKFLYPNDFKLVVQVIIRELKANSMYTEGGEEGKLFKDYATALIVILESDIYSKDYERMLIDEIHAILNTIIGDFESTVDAIDCCKLVLSVVKFVMGEKKD